MEMDLPRPADFEDVRPRRRAQITGQRVGVLVLLLLGGGFLGLATEFWPKDGLNKLVRPVRAALFQDEVDELRSEIQRSLRSGQPKQALQLAKRLIEIDPEAGYIERARVYAVLKDYDQSVADLEKALERNPQNSGALYLRAAVHIQRGDLPSALADASRLVELEPREGLLLRARIHRQQKDYEKAAADLTEAIAADPAYQAAYEYRYQVYLDMNDFEKALADAERIAEISPSRGMVFKGDVYAKQKNYDASIEAYTKAIESDPENATAYNNRGYHRALARRDLDKAAEDAATAIALAGEEPAYVDTRGYVAYLQGKYKAALRDFDAAIEAVEEEGIDPEFAAEIYFHRALVYRKLGEDKLAESDFAKAKEFGFEWTELPEPLGKEL